ncbi:MAG: hypothetical protein HY738_12405 [Bacteroidia bacterium]|nr:hypothetical protein [Bacteroidia bacterium]
MKPKFFLFILTFAIFFLNFAFIGLGQTPQLINYQGVARNSTGTILLNQAISLRMSILQGSAIGVVVYSETHAATSNDYGVFDLVVGNGAVISGTFSAIDWGADIYFLKVEMDGTGGSNYEFMGTSQLLSVPYSLHAKTAENVTGTITESDPVFTAWDKTTGISITESQISDLQNYLTSEIDGSVTNELQLLSISNDTIYLTNGGFAKLPAGFSGNYNDLTNKPDFTGWDTNAANDFNGDYNNLTNTPTIPANISQLTNDAGYISGFTEVDGSCLQVSAEITMT